MSYSTKGSAMIRNMRRYTHAVTDIGSSLLAAYICELAAEWFGDVWTSDPNASLTFDCAIGKSGKGMIRIRSYNIRDKVPAEAALMLEQSVNVFFAHWIPLYCDDTFVVHRQHANKALTYLAGSGRSDEELSVISLDAEQRLQDFIPVIDFELISKDE